MNYIFDGLKRLFIDDNKLRQPPENNLNNLNKFEKPASYKNINSSLPMKQSIKLDNNLTSNFLKMFISEK